MAEIHTGRRAAVRLSGKQLLDQCVDELVRKAEADGDVEFLKEGVRVLSQALMEARGRPTHWG